MATELKKQSNRITADGDYFIVVPKGRPVNIEINFLTPGSAGTVAIKKSSGVAYRDSLGTALSVAYNHVAGGTENAYQVEPLGGHVNLTAASFAGSPVVEVIWSSVQQYR